MNIKDISGSSDLFLINVGWAIMLFVGILGFVLVKSLKKEPKEEKDEFD